jgi:hypothetical protein
MKSPVTAGCAGKGKMLKTKTITLIVAFLLASTGLAVATPIEWKVLVDKTKSCQLSVPPDWVVDASYPSQGSSPDAQVSVLTLGIEHGQTLKIVKEETEKIFSPIKIFEDSKKRLWFSYKEVTAPEGSRDINYYVAIPVNGSVCGARISMRNSSLAPIGKQIVESISAVK